MVPKNWFSGVLAATILVAASAHLSHAQQTGSQATVPSIDVAAEVASSVYYMSTVVEAVRAEADSEIRTKDRRIRELESKGRLAAAENAEIKRLQLEVVAELEARDAELARQVAAFRNAVTDLSSVPEGAAILASRRPGNLRHAREALIALELQLAEADQRAIDIRRAQRLRSIAIIAWDDRNRGEASTDEVISLYEQVVVLDATSADWIQLARLYEDNGDLRKWETASQQATVAVGNERERAAALIELGYSELSKGLYEASLDSMYAAKEILEELHERDPDNDLLARDLFVGSIALGDAWYQRGLRRGNAMGSLLEYEYGLAIIEELAAGNPSNTEIQADLAIALIKVGEAMREGKYLPEAQASFEDAQRVVEQLADSDPTNLEAQHQLAITLNKLGEVYHLQGQQETAQETLERSLALSLDLSARDPTNAEWKRSILVSRIKLGDATGDISHYRDALESVQQMETNGSLRPEDWWLINDLKQRASGN